MKNKYPLLLLFSVVVLFSILGSFSEGFDDMAVPSCTTGECDDDDYMLKSQIVPPVCPACPPFIGSSTDTLTSTVTEETEKEKELTQKDSNYSYKQTTETQDQLSGNALNGNALNGNSLNGNSMNGLSGTNSLNNLFNTKLAHNETNIDEYKKEIDNLKEQLKELKTFDGVCPPCPACERCPEHHLIARKYLIIGQLL